MTLQMKKDRPRRTAEHTPRQPPDPASYWLIAGKRNNRVEVLTIRMDDEQETLPVLPPRRPQVPPKGASQVRGLRLRLRRAHDHEKRQGVLILRLRVPPDRQGRRFRPAPPRPERQRPVVEGPGVEGRQAIS